MMKRLLSLTLALMLMTACGAAPIPASTEPPPSVPQEISEVTPTPAPEPSTVPAQPSSSSESAPATVPITTVPTPTPEVAAVVNAAKLDSETVEYLYSWNPTGYTYHSIGRRNIDDLFNELHAYKPVKDAKQEENPVDLLGFLVKLADGTKRNYYVTETQLYSKEDGVLDATPEQCKKLHELATKNKSSVENNAYPQWLTYMSPQRITEVAFDGFAPDFTQDISFVTSDRIFIDTMARGLAGLPVKRDSAKRVEGKINFDTPATLMTLKLTFDSGVIYDVYITDDLLGIMSSDMSYSLYYTATSKDVCERLRRTAKVCYDKIYPSTSCVDIPATDGGNGTTVPNGGNPSTGKPVIYLYPEKQTDVSVKLDFGGELWYTYPTIKDGGWNVTAYPDGRLVNKSDSTEHYYLFWDGNSDTDWRFDEGFCVAGGDTEVFLRQKLAYMGLTPREYNDFITYWVPKMKNNKYNLITFASEQYEQLAPLTVSPAPDSVLRVHMVYKPLTARQEIPEQKLEAFERKGFTMVEWGGSIAK